MKELIYDFPPTIWQVQDWAFSPYAGTCLISLFIAVVVLAGRSASDKIRGRHGLGWASIFWISLFYWLSMAQQTSEPTRPVSLGQYVVASLILLMSAVSLVIMFFRMYKSGNAAEFFWMTTLPAIAVVVFLSVLLPGVQYPRSAIRRTQCRNNLKLLGMAMHNYHDVHGRFPSAAAGLARTSWRIGLLPYVEQQALYKQYDQEFTWDSPANINLASQSVSAYSCPQLPAGREWNSQKQFLTAYVAPTGIGTIFDGSETPTFQSVSDGTSNTLLVLEARGTNIVWTEPRDADGTTFQVSVNDGTNQLDVSESVLSSYHLGGAQALRADGSVTFFSTETDPGVLKALLTRAGGDLIPEASP